MNKNRFYTDRLFSKGSDYFVLIVIALAIRLYYVNTIDLWGDELIGFFQWNLDTIEKFPLSIRKTPLYIIVNVAYKSLIPESWLYTYNFVPRIPALIFGILTVVVLYDAYKRYIGNIPAVIIGCFACASYPLIIYSRESRVYSMTHFFVALYLWLYLSILSDPKRWKIIFLFIASILGFFTYPYFVFIIIIFYVCLSINIFLTGDKKQHRLFFTTFISFALIAFTLLFFMKSSFSSSYYSQFYSPMKPSISFIFYALKSLFSYYSGNSYILVLISIIFPVINLFKAHRKKAPINRVYMVWILSTLLIFGHIFILFITVNIFNPRHVGFIAIPFIATISLGLYEIYRYLDSMNKGKTGIYLKPVFFLIIVIIFAFSTRDFRYYLKTGINYHAGTNDYSKNIQFINSTLNHAKKNKSLLILCYDDNLHYNFYHYRTGKRVVSLNKISSDYNIDLSKMLYYGFIIKQNNKKRGEIPNSLLQKFSRYANSDIIIFISKTMINLEQLKETVQTIEKTMCSAN